MPDDFLPFDKKLQAKKPKKKEKLGPTRKEERRQAHLDQYEENDKAIYEAIVERSYDWIEGYHKCEYCHERPAEQMHHDPPRSVGGYTSLETTFYICRICHDAYHAGKIKGVNNGANYRGTGDTV